MSSSLEQGGGKIGSARLQVETYVSEGVPCLAYRIVQDDERSAWSKRVTEKVVRLSMNCVVGGDIRLVCEGAHHVY